MLTESYVDEVIADFEEGDILLLQNEVNRLPYMVDKAYEKGMQIALNPSPFNEKLNDVDMSKISYFLMNEVEGEQITGFSEPEKIIDRVVELYPEAKIVLTLGNDGAIYADKNVMFVYLLTLQAAFSCGPLLPLSCLCLRMQSVGTSLLRSCQSPRPVCRQQQPRGADSQRIPSSSCRSGISARYTGSFCRRGIRFPVLPLSLQ